MPDCRPICLWLLLVCFFYNFYLRKIYLSNCISINILEAYNKHTYIIHIFLCCACVVKEELEFFFNEFIVSGGEVKITATKKKPQTINEIIKSLCKSKT